jgi:hypothetical protein
MNRTIFAKAGAVAYVIWGALRESIIEAVWLLANAGKGARAQARNKKR